MYKSCHLGRPKFVRQKRKQDLRCGPDQNRVGPYQAGNKPFGNMG